MKAPVIQAQELRKNIDDPEWVILDCQFDLMDPDAGYRSFLAGHLPGSQYVHLDHDLSDHDAAGRGRHPLPGIAKLNHLFQRVGINEQSKVVAYDNAGGVFAARLWWLLCYSGHGSAAVLDGGISAWKAAGYETSHELAERQQGTFTVVPRQEQLVTIDEVPNRDLLIDSREPERYRGENEPIDPVAGHIPGAINFYWKNNLDKSGMFKRPELIATQFLDLYAGKEAEDAVFYCGSGVSACHNLLAAVYAGLPRPQLYAGSWSEWCADPARPVAVAGE